MGGRAPLRTLLVAALLAVAACGPVRGGGGTSPAAPPSHSPTLRLPPGAAVAATPPTAADAARPGTETLVVLRSYAPDPHNPHGRDAPLWHVVRVTDGREVASLQGRDGPGGFAFATVSARGAYFTCNGRLVLVAFDGSLHDLGPLAGMTDAGGTVRVGPDCDRWTWNVTLEGVDGVAVSTMYLGGADLPTRVVDRRTDGSRAYTPVAWTRAGIIVAATAGAAPYTAYDDGDASRTLLLDPRTLAVQPLTGDPPCDVAGAADDGTVACTALGWWATGFPSPGGEVRLVRAGGIPARSVALPETADDAGNALLSPDGTHLVYGAGHNDGDGDDFAVRTYSLDLRDPAAVPVRIGPANLVPAGLLADGTLVGTVWAFPAREGERQTGVLVDAAGAVRPLGEGRVVGVAG